MLFPFSGSEIRGEDPSFANSGQSVYIPPQKWRITGYSKAPVRNEPVAPVGKETVYINKTSGIASEAVYSEPAVTPYQTTVPPTGKNDVDWNWNLDSENVTANDRLAAFMLEPRPIRESLFQGVSAIFSYLPNTGKDQLGQYQITGSMTFGIPFPAKDSPLLISPLFSWTEMDMPYQTETFFGQQKKLVKTGLSLEYLLPVSNSVLLDGNLQILYASDGKAGGNETIRLIGYGALVWKIGPTAELVGGAFYNDVSDTSVIPIGGLLWKPSDDLYWEILFPRPKVAWRLPPALCGNSQDLPYWIYLAGEYTTERWEIETENNIDWRDAFYSALKYEDIRILAGIERKGTDQVNWALEGGVVLDRELKINGTNKNYYQKIRPDTVGFARFKVMY